MNREMKRILNINYAGIQGAYWMCFGVISTFASVLLLDRGYSNADIGMIFAVGNVAAVILQPIMADIADRSKRTSLFGVLQIATFFLILFTLASFILQRKSFALTAVYIMLLGWVVALQPLLNSLAFKLEESGVHINFGIARSVGSLAYSIICGVLGTVIEAKGIEILPLTNGTLLIFMFVGLSLASYHLKKTKDTMRQGQCEKEELRNRQVDCKRQECLEEPINLTAFVRRNRMFCLMTIGVVGVFFANATLNNFMLQIIMPLGGDSEDMGRIFALLAFLEVPMLCFFDQINRRFSCQTLLKIASVTYVIKISVTWMAGSVEVVMLSQLLQLTSFALFLPAMVKFIDGIMSKGEAVKGQALYTTMSTVSSVLSSLVGGLLLDVSGAKFLLMVATISTAVGAAIIFLTIDQIQKNEN